MTSAASFTCASCRVIFENVEDQRTHYQSDWHRYNLRRKVGDLPPVTESIYKQKLTSAAASKADQEAQQEEASKARECLPCRKTFSSAAAYENHVLSKKHIDQVAKFGGDAVKILAAREVSPAQPSLPVLPENATDAQVDAAIEEHLKSTKSRLEVTDCLYCPKKFDSLQENLEHMHSLHSFYIPDVDCLTNLEGLMRHLADKVSVWHVCLACGGAEKQPFASLEAVRRHMLDKGHNKIRFDDDGSSELADFFDYSKINETMVDAEDADSDDFTSASEGEGDDFGYDENALILAPDESELILPNGARLGSRTYRHYYRQNLIPYLSAESRPNALRPVNEPRPDGTVVRGQHYVPPPRVMAEQEKRDRKLEGDARKQFALRMGLKQNGLQTHYREQLLQ
jgi:pre-60S factor REI1